ncbi:hypothetical protein QBC32DRAFT_384138 [Pseudoneurospora amorphoporcata]|uniref:Uncharacterized protein n=1 Tax=Pseudoneurospora amorphoporcata TaxID=241081 RepID=A0AAN6NLP8_9PEZI|nr:hypothetical protein QBC32DRAFT_384138 [Pseudoneurospora amorphoporcata]
MSQVPRAPSAFDLNSLRSAIDKTLEVKLDTTICRTALSEIPKDAALTNLLEGLDQEDGLPIPRKHFETAAIIANYLAFQSIIAPLSRLYRSNFEFYDDVVSDLARAKEELKTARQVANDAQSNFDQKNLDFVNLKTAYDTLLAEYNTLKTQAPSNGAAPVTTTKAAMSSSLRQTVENPPIFTDAGRRLQELYIKNISFADFELELTNLMNLCGLNDSMKVHHLRNKINKRLRNAFAYRDLPPKNDFKRWLEICRTVAGNLEDADHRQKMANHFFNPGSDNGNSNGNSGRSSTKLAANDVPVTSAAVTASPVTSPATAPPDLSKHQTAAPRALISRVSVAAVRQTTIPPPKKEETEPTSPAIEKEEVEPSSLPAIKKEKIKPFSLPAIKKEKIQTAPEPSPAPELLPTVTKLTPKIDPKTGYRTVPAPVKALVAQRAEFKIAVTGTAALLIKTKSPALYEPYVRVAGRRVSIGTYRP